MQHAKFVRDIICGNSTLSKIRLGSLGVFVAAGGKDKGHARRLLSTSRCGRLLQVGHQSFPMGGCYGYGE